jgi:hypothetical protein
MFNQKGKRKEKGSKTQRSMILYFILVIEKSCYQEGCFKKVLWKGEVLNHPKFFFQDLTRLVRWNHRLPEPLHRTLESPIGHVRSIRLVRSETGFQNHSTAFQSPSPDLSGGGTGHVRSTGLVWCSAGFSRLDVGLQRGSPDLPDGKHPNGSFWGGDYK